MTPTPTARDATDALAREMIEAWTKSPEWSPWKVAAEIAMRHIEAMREAAAKALEDIRDGYGASLNMEEFSTWCAVNECVKAIRAIPTVTP